MSLSACASKSLFSYQMLSLLVSVQSTALSCVATLLKSVGGSGSLFSVVSVLSGVVTLWGSKSGSCNLLAVLSFMCPTTRAIWSNISSWCSWPAMNSTCWRTTDDLEVCFFFLSWWVPPTILQQKELVLWQFRSPGPSGAIAIAEFSMRKRSQQQESSMKLKRPPGGGFQLVLNTWPF